MTDDSLWIGEPDDLARTPKMKTPPTRRRTNSFIGCPMSWLKRALSAMHNAKHLAVALYIYRLTVVRRSKTVTISNTELQREFGIDRYVKYRALSRLERAGLIRICNRTGRAVKVTLLK
jgi:hypothetical protein